MLSTGSLKLMAKVCHEANKAICEKEGDTSQKPWDQLSEDEKQASIDGVMKIVNDPDSFDGPAIHDNWVKFKEDNGWQYGEEKNTEAKTHPSMVPYDGLSETEQLKDEMFVAIVKSFLMDT